MAELTNSEFYEIKNRQSLEDFKRLVLLLDEEGFIEVVDDPDPPSDEEAAETEEFVAEEPSEPDVAEALSQEASAAESELISQESVQAEVAGADDGEENPAAPAEEAEGGSEASEDLAGALPADAASAEPAIVAETVEDAPLDPGAGESASVQSESEELEVPGLAVEGVDIDALADAELGNDSAASSES